MIKLRKFDEITMTADVEYEVINPSKYTAHATVFQAQFEIEGRLTYIVKVMESIKYDLVINEDLYPKMESNELLFYSNIGGYDIADVGNAFKVFATVLKIFKEDFLDKERPRYFHFSAEESSRKKLYNHFANNVEKYLPGYSFMGVPDDRRSTDVDSYYYFERK